MLDRKLMDYRFRQLASRASRDAGRLWVAGGAAQGLLEKRFIRLFDRIHIEM